MNPKQEQLKQNAKCKIIKKKLMKPNQVRTFGKCDKR